MAIHAWTTSVFAHISLDIKAAPVASSYKAVFQVGHGCQGQATTGVTVKIPAGFKDAKPMPKAGWTLATTHAALAVPYDSHGKRITDDIAMVSWTADSPAAALPDAQYDEFVLRGQLPDTAGPLWFAVQQRCGAVVQEWADIPPSGATSQRLKRPAAQLVVTPLGSVQPFTPVLAPNRLTAPAGSDHSAHR